MQIHPNTLYNISNLGQGVQKPNAQRNYCIFNQARVNEILKQAPEALYYVGDFLKNAKTEEQVLEGLYVLDRMLEMKVQGVDKLYPVIAKFNDTNSPDIQVMLAGIYRKTLVPDAFGPLNKMMLRQTFFPNSPYFDPTEEIGGAILEYLRAEGAKSAYGQK